MNRFGRPALACSSLATRSVVLVSCASSGDTSSDTQPSTPPVRVEDRPEHVGRARDVVDRQLEEQVLARLAGLQLAANRRVVVAAVLDGVVEDRRIRREAGHRQFADVAFERPAFEQVARDVVEPKALADIVQLPGRVHRFTCHLSEGRGAAGADFGRHAMPSNHTPEPRASRTGGGDLVPQADHRFRTVVLVAERAQARWCQGRTVVPTRHPGRASAPRARAGNGRKRTAGHCRARRARVARRGPPAPRFRASASPPGQPSRNSDHPGRLSRISRVVRPSYSP